MMFLYTSLFSNFIFYKILYSLFSLETVDVTQVLAFVGIGYQHLEVFDSFLYYVIKVFFCMFFHHGTIYVIS